LTLPIHPEALRPDLHGRVTDAPFLLRDGGFSFAAAAQTPLSASHHRIEVSFAIGYNAGQQMSSTDLKQSEVQHSEAGSKEPHAAAEDLCGTLRIARRYQQNGNVRALESPR